MEHIFKLFEFNIYNDKGLDKESDSDEDFKKINKDNGRFMIQMFGINEEGKKASILIEEYSPFFYLKVGDNWGQKKKTAFYDHLKSTIGKYYANSILECKLIERKKLYGFDAGKKHRFIEIKFANINIYNKVKNLWYEDSMNEKERKLIQNGYKFIHNNEITFIELYEANIPPLLRFFHIREISPSGWIALPVKKTIQITGNNKTTSCDFEFVINYKNIIALNNKEDRVPYKIMSFDIEASSSHGDFPVPIKSYKKLATNIVDYFDKLGDIKNEDCRNELREIIKGGFGFKNIENIDIVYPKEKIKDEEGLNNRTENWLKTKVRDRVEEGNEEHLLETLFENANKLLMKKDEPEEEDLNSDNESDNENIIEEEKYFKISYNNNKNYKNKESTIVDIICDKKFEREGKISELIRSLRNHFPPLEGDKVTFIGSTFINYGENDPYLNHCIVLNSCNDLKNAQIETYNTEKEVLIAWTNLVQRENPDIIIGYNIFSFDYEFMFRRSQELFCVEEFLKLSRNNNEICNTFDFKNPTKIDIDRSSTTLASGTYELAIIKMNGRLQVDMLNWFRRTENLTSYKLDYVGGHFIGDEVKSLLHLCRDDSSCQKVTRVLTSNMMGLQLESYIHFEEINHSSDYYKDGKKFKVINVCKQEGWFEILGEENPSAKKVKWGLAKDDVTPKDIFRMTNEGPASRSIIAKYCIQDCNLVHYLFNKVDVVTDLVEMSKLCSVPMSFLIFRGQGIKLTSYVAKKCREKGVLMPCINKGCKDDGYEGAIVLNPKCGLYLDDPVCVGDFASLYPSSMLSENLCPSSKVWTKIYDLAGNLILETGEKDDNGNYIFDNLPEYEYVDVNFDTFRWIRKTPKSRAEKIRSGFKICRFAQPLIVNEIEEKAIMPAILQELLKARKDTRKLIPQTSDEFMKNILDKRQQAYKVTANSLYGQLGAKTSTFYEPDIAASTTATGRLLLTFAKKVVEECYTDINVDTRYGVVNTKAEYVYGDSVANYTPVYVKINGNVDILTIEQLAEKYGNNNWIKCIEEGKQEKEFCELDNVQTWTENGWTKLFRVIRHELACNKRMIRVLTHTGCVDVTDDHSLVNSDGTEISPKDCSIGLELLHKDLPIFDKKETYITEDEAQIMGFFFGDGSCGIYNCASGKKSSWALNNSSLILLNEYQDLCRKVYSEFDWKIRDTIESSGVYKLTPNSKGQYGKIVSFVKNYRHLLYSENIKVIPLEILSSNENIQKAFWKGMYDADGDKDNNGCIRIDQKNQLSATLIYLLAKNLGYSVSINTRLDKQDIYRITITTKKQRKNPIAIKKIYEIQYSGFIYDITTENHHFAAGVGNMIVHNTDSVFFKFNLTDKETGEKILGDKALELSIEIAQEACHHVSNVLKQPHDFEYEKTFMPFCLLSKKRYVSIKYELDPKKGKRNEMGIVLKRRDNAPIVKDIYGGVIDILMKEKNIQKAMDFVNKCLQELVNGNVPIEKLIITKSLRSFYKNPQSIAHKVLADRISQRDPGNKPTSGDRIPFVYVVTKGLQSSKKIKVLQGDKIETPTFIKENNLKIDYSFYITNQIMKPLLQLFGLVLEEIWTNQKPARKAKITNFKKEIEKINNTEEDEKKCEKKINKIKDKEVQALIFDKYLRDTNNAKEGNQNLSKFFCKTN
uniref:DNA polymerase n=1 Tax=viral metagenome TaxID=1070528 RepID=A0A6C0KQ87_9ZZZZ